MRRTTAILAAATTGAALALTTATPALAAQGILTVSGKEYTNPAKGCYTGIFWPLVVNNQTDTPVTAYDGDNCRGRALGTVGSRQHRTFEFGMSVYVPR